MPLIQCPDCGKHISDTASTCIGCGRPMVYQNSSSKISKEKTTEDYTIIILSVCIIIGFFYWIGGGKKNLARPVRAQTGAINAYDPATKTIIDPITIFMDYDNRNLGITGETRHGEKVVILETTGTGTPHGVKIKTASGVVGWVSNWFVTEN